MAKKSSYEEELRKKLKAAFDEVDTDKSGSISHTELKVMLSKAGYEATNKVAKVCITFHIAPLSKILNVFQYKCWTHFVKYVNTTNFFQF